ncbi:MAG TPA: MFS transporter [Caldithrix abyssi]|uniref:MFS transporter n=1 Tax=Caldithrix abyssi TaxID=187145 RepID=A0A7V4TZZ0_CALAY|nr:MFS transporter [Caldithrix abyssi]
MLKNHPKGLMTLFFTEMWERFGFYTMLAVFTLYMDETLGWSDAYKGQIYGLFLGFVYFTPIAGGWIADKFLGYRKTIIIGAITLGTGYAMLAFSGPDRIWLFYVALIVMIIGNGMFKANISVLVGNLYEPGSPIKDVGYNIFYMGINLGAFIAPLAATFLHDVFGNYNSAFMAAAIGMALSLIVFEVWKSKYIYADNKHEAGQENQKAQEAERLSPEKERERLVALGIIFLIVIFFWMSFHQNGFALTLFAQRSTVDEYTLRESDFTDWQGFKQAALNDSIPLAQKLAQLNLSDQPGEEDLNKLNQLIREPDLFYKNGVRVEHFPYENVDPQELKKDLSVFGLYSVKIPDNKRIAMVKRVKLLDKLMADNNLEQVGEKKAEFRKMNRDLLSERYPQVKPGYYLLNAETYATFNPLFILLLTPLVVSLFNWLRKRGKEPSSPGKIGIGMFISGLAMVIMIIASLAGGNADANNMSPNWLISSYFVVTIGELFLSPMGLSFVSKVAPARMRGLMMGGWFGATAVGNYLSGLIGSFYNTLTHDQFFGILTVLLFLSALMVRLVLNKLKHATEGA